MDDLISRQAAIDTLATWDWQDLYLPIHFKQLLDQQPAVQDAYTEQDVRNAYTDGYSDGIHRGYEDAVRNYKNLALKLCEKGKSDDLISRQAAIDYCYALINAENIDDSADEWNYSQERVNQTEVILHHLEFMPSAEPERQKGRWVYPFESTKTICVCSICGHGTKTGYNPYNFCPHCGAKMTNT